MRPVDKGSSPYVSINKYSEALPFLEEKIGSFCSFCEFPIDHVPEVEHKIAKNQNGPLTDWENLLLGCKYCNTRKKEIIGINPMSIWLWPDSDNTFRAFNYDGGIPKVNPSLEGDVKIKAMRMFTDLKLDNIPRGKDRDRRFSKRNNAFSKANKALITWQNAKENGNCEDVKNIILELATSSGFFSVWMNVFRDDSDMKIGFISVFTGTGKSCFDFSGNPLPRINGLL